MNHIIELCLTMIIIQINRNKIKSNRQRNRKTNRQTFRGIELLRGQSQKGIRLLSNKSIVFNCVDNKIVKHCTNNAQRDIVQNIYHNAIQHNILNPLLKSGSEPKPSTFQICISIYIENLINSLFKFELKLQRIHKNLKMKPIQTQE